MVELCTNVRTKQLVIFVVLFIGYATYSLNRKGVSLVLPELLNSGLDKSDAGLIISSQNIAYAISKFLGGILSDRLSSRLLFGFGLLLSGTATIIFGLSTQSVTIFSVLWFCNGFAQGVGWPSCAKVLRHWYSPDQFGTFWSLLSASANISGGLSPFVAAFITINYGWRMTLILFGGVSFLMSAMAFLVIVDKPEDIGIAPINPNVTPTKNDKKDSKQTKSNITYKDLLTSPFIWLISFSYMVVYAAKTSACDWGQMYLIEERHRSPLVGSSFTSSVESGGFFGGVIAGYLTDLILRRASNGSSTKTNSSARLPVATIMMLIVALCLHTLRFHVHEMTSHLFITGLGFMLGCALYGPIAIFGVMASESAPSHLSGTSHAIVALAANVGAIISGLPFSLLAKRYGWGEVFFLLELVTGATVLIMLFGHRIQPNYGASKQKSKVQ
ncbi:hypothetical protein RDWZM_002086 [Blomia tropicalis]|uniref:Major facilitator superfamily (MFS) profile domain-containing protein n=1 Tax=Blomia tropicalis TaxID=40697 RepID=A0A9Q0RRW9_BLOTA|nr:hypothetical protein RDWZM_002086 [Blomia tropicalis]